MTSMAGRRWPPLSIALCLFGIGMTPSAGMAQTPDIPVLVIEEPTPKPVADRIRLNPVRPLPWSATRELLAAEDLPAPARPSQFTLSPRDPYHMPGGLIALSGTGSGQTGSTWQPLDPDPTGTVRIDDDNAVYLLLLRLKPEYKYSVDLSLSSSEAARLEVETCTTGPLWRMDTRVDGAQHVLIVAGTDRDGEACFRLHSTGGKFIYTYLYSATISELGPRPPTRYQPPSKF